MMKNNALINLFIKYYHMKNSNIKIYKDNYILKMMRDEEYNKILNKLKKISLNSFKNNYIINTYLLPRVLASSIINEKKLISEIKLGTKQFIYFNSGYDMLGYKYRKIINVYEIDTKETIKNKLLRIKRSTKEDYLVKRIILKDNINKYLIKNNFDKNKKTHVSLLGQNNKNLKNILNSLSKILKEGSSILFDYNSKEYLLDKIEVFLEEKGFFIYEIISNTTINNKYFYNYNTINPDNKIILNNTIYIFAIKKDIMI